MSRRGPWRVGSTASRLRPALVAPRLRSVEDASNAFDRELPVAGIERDAAHPARRPGTVSDVTQARPLGDDFRHFGGYFDSTQRRDAMPFGDLDDASRAGTD
jgi:hypothetical protein